jgi:hypothetical protein
MVEMVFDSKRRADTAKDMIEDVYQMGRKDARENLPVDESC